LPAVPSPLVLLSGFFDMSDECRVSVLLMPLCLSDIESPSPELDPSPMFVPAELSRRSFLPVPVSSCFTVLVAVLVMPLLDTSALPDDLDLSSDSSESFSSPLS